MDQRQNTRRGNPRSQRAPTSTQPEVASTTTANISMAENLTPTTGMQVILSNPTARPQSARNKNTSPAHDGKVIDESHQIHSSLVDSQDSLQEFPVQPHHNGGSRGRARGGRGGGRGGRGGRNSQAKALPFEDWYTLPPEILAETDTVHQMAQNSLDMLASKDVTIAIEPSGYLVSAISEELLERTMLLLDEACNQELVYMRRRSAKERLLTNLTRVQQEVDTGLRVEFTVDKSLMGLIVGTQGSNIRKVTEETGVDRVVVDREQGVVRIVGKNAEAVRRARNMLEVVSVQIPVPADKLGYLVGRNGANIDSLKAKTGVSVVNMDSANACVRVMGVASAVQSATLLVRSQLGHLQKMDDEARELELIKRQLETMNVNWGEGVMAAPPAARQGGPVASLSGPGRGNSGRGGARKPASQVTQIEVDHSSTGRVKKNQNVQQQQEPQQQLPYEQQPYQQQPYEQQPYQQQPNQQQRYQQQPRTDNEEGSTQKGGRGKKANNSMRLGGGRGSRGSAGDSRTEVNGTQQQPQAVQSSSTASKAQAQPQKQASNGGIKITIKNDLIQS